MLGLRAACRIRVLTKARHFDESGENGLELFSTCAA